MLLGFELLVQKNKKGPFAVAVAICATISYFFFACEVVFVVIYFFLRCLDKDFEIDMKKFGLLILEAVIGVMISAVIFLPSALSVMGNKKSDVSVGCYCGDSRFQRKETCYQIRHCT